MKYDKRIIDLFDQPKIKGLYAKLCVEEGRKEITVGGVKVKASDLAHHYGDKPQKADKYKEHTDADMEQTDVGGDTPDVGDGDSQEQE